MPALWQDLLAGLAALVALAYLVRRRLRMRGAACEGCASGGCAQDAPAGDPAPQAAGLVTIERLRDGDGAAPIR